MSVDLNLIHRHNFVDTVVRQRYVYTQRPMKVASHEILRVRHAEPFHFEVATGSVHRDGPGSEGTTVPFGMKQSAQRKNWRLRSPQGPTVARHVA